MDYFKIPASELGKNSKIPVYPLGDSGEVFYEIALETGFEDPGYFSYCFRQRCGLTPKNFRQEAKSHE